VAGIARRSDDNTLLIQSPGFVVDPHLRKLNYNPLTSFEPMLTHADAVIE
jgi:hypothetical protein